MLLTVFGTCSCLLGQHGMREAAEQRGKWVKRVKPVVEQRGGWEKRVKQEHQVPCFLHVLFL